MKRRSSLLTSFLLLSFALFNTASAQFWNDNKPDLLAADVAFVHSVDVLDGSLNVHWFIAKDYYMYRDQFAVKASNQEVVLGKPVMPEGVIEDDPEFGEVVVYFNSVNFTVPIESAPEGAEQLELILEAQGCNKPVGVCYPPQFRSVNLSLPSEFKAATATQDTTNSAQTASEDVTASAQTKQTNSEKSYWTYVLAAFGAGILLSFTPCVLPMIPILTGVIAGQNSPSRWRSGWLSICYVLGTIATYAIAGWAAGASGVQLQAYFQSPVAIGVICLILIGLAASLFGLFKIQMPSSIQTRLNNASVETRSASLSTFVLGMFSALIVGACVSPILILNLGAAITQGDPVLGASIMAAMAMGMGLLLIAFGFGAGWLLPKAGEWMNEIQVLFGFMVLGVAVYLAGFIGWMPVLLLWALLLLWIGFYLLKLAQKHEASFIKAVGFGLVLWGAMALIGGANGGSNVLKPIESLSFSGVKKEKVPFVRVTTLEQARGLLDEAQKQGKPSYVDFYADWCLDCKRMAASTFTEPEIHQALSGWQLIEIDVTKTNEQSQEVKKYFDVFGPPASLLIKPDGKEWSELRQYGYMDKQALLALLSRAQ